MTKLLKPEKIIYIKTEKIIKKIKAHSKIVSTVNNTNVTVPEAVEYRNHI